MKESRYDSSRFIRPFTFPFNCDAVIRLSRRTGQTIVANMGVFLALRLNTNRDVLTRQVRSYSPSILRRKVEGSNKFTFFNLLSNHKVSKSTPTPGNFGSFTILLCFDTNKGICDHAIRLCPSINNFRRRRIAKYLPNSS
ncbi:hypothetical protein D3C76_1092430 [compost metagenome]